MEQRTDGGPAFPRPASETQIAQGDGGYSSESQDGMSLRDYFAAHALQLIAREGLGPEYQSSTIFEVARAVYSIADAMLAERAK